MTNQLAQKLLNGGNPQSQPAQSMQDVSNQLQYFTMLAQMLAMNPTGMP